MEIYNIGPDSMAGLNDIVLAGNSRLVFSRDEVKIKGIMTKRSRSKYRPHYGAKEAAKYATTAPHRLGAAEPKPKRTRKVKETTNA